MKATESAPIIAHPDVRRMLLTMRALTQAARAICYATAIALDRSRAQRRRRRAQGRPCSSASLLTPVAKAFSTDIGNEVASLGVQVHGGMGYIEETGAAQLFATRGSPDLRRHQRHPGDRSGHPQTAAGRRRGGRGASRRTARHRRDTSSASNDPAFGWTAVRLGEAVESLSRATDWLLGRLDKEPDAALAGATPYLRLFGLATGGCFLAKQALAALRLGARRAARIALTRFFAENFAVGAGGTRAHRGRRRAGPSRRRRGAYRRSPHHMTGFASAHPSYIAHR